MKNQKEYCIHDKTICIDSRKGEGYIRRRRKCIECGHRYTTVEVEIFLPKYKKRLGNRSVWDLLREQLFTTRHKKAILEISNIMHGKEGRN